MLRISRDNIHELYAHCEERYPEEACGFIYQSGKVHFGENIQNKLHGMDAKTYPRDATRGYSFSIKDLKLLESSLDTDDPVVSIYHSHPDVGAYFSEEDKDKALFEGELIHPVSYLVVDVKKKSVDGAKLFQFMNSEFICTNEYDDFGELTI